MAESLKNLSVKIKNYKCFSNEEQGFERILPINIIIGRNNSGKSTLLELIQYVANGGADISEGLWHKGQRSTIILEDLLSESDLRRVFPENIRGADIPGKNHWEYGRKWIGKPLKWQLEKNHNNNTFLALTPSFDLQQRKEHYEQQLAHSKSNPLAGKIFKRLFAERDITKEPYEDVVSLMENGRGATNLIQNFITNAGLPSELVEKVLLGELNQVCAPDTVFTDIVCQQLNGNWEIYLEEKQKGRIPLSHTGSGFKTILLVLCFLYLLPYAEKKELNQYIFAFEELENNLHPALLRRLLLYLRDKALKDGCLFFFTTHSNVVIDLFSRDENAQMVHVTHNGEMANVRTIKTYIENKGILDDLDIRASDLLQSNGIIWVEGPSDRLYLNRWIELWFEGKLQEGTHYQCVFYGGRLLAHLSAEATDTTYNNLLKILKVNRNAIMIIDSDKRHKAQPLNSTKSRIKSEIESISGLCWITKGREIENYIPKSTVDRLYPVPTISQVDQYNDFSEYLEGIKTGAGKEFLNNKVLFAEKICQKFRKEDMAVLDLDERIEEVCNRIESWNGLKRI